MQTIKNLAVKHSSKLKYLFLCGAIIASINTLSRADYNFVVYLYMFYVWTFMGDKAEVQRQDKLGTFYILIYSLLIDVIWCSFWGGKWDNAINLIHEITLFFSWIGIIWKILIILLICVLETDTIKTSLMSFIKNRRNGDNNNPHYPFDQEN